MDETSKTSDMQESTIDLAKMKGVLHTQGGDRDAVGEVEAFTAASKQEEHEGEEEETELGIHFGKASSMKRALRKILTTVKEEIGEEYVRNRELVDVFKIFIKTVRKDAAREERKAMADSGSEDTKLRARVRDLEEELRLALSAGDDIKALKMKIFQLIDRQKIEKEARISAEEQIEATSMQVDMLSTHMEKLMMHLKHEAAAKSKAQELHRRAEREADLLRVRISALERKVAAKDRALMEVREGSRILEDQLRLMDEKYLELRTKLDYTRATTAKKVTKARREASQLRTKFALMTGNMLLDNIKMPKSADTLVQASMDEMERDLGESSFNLSAYDFGASQQPGSLQSISMPSLQASSFSSSSSRSSKRGKKTRRAKRPEVEEVVDKIKSSSVASDEQEWTEAKIQQLLEKKH